MVVVVVVEDIIVVVVVAAVVELRVVAFLVSRPFKGLRTAFDVLSKAYPKSALTFS